MSFTEFVIFIGIFFMVGLIGYIIFLIKSKDDSVEIFGDAQEKEIKDFKDF
jgi:hypothetical protein